MVALLIFQNLLDDPSKFPQNVVLKLSRSGEDDLHVDTGPSSGESQHWTIQKVKLMFLARGSSVYGQTAYYTFSIDLTPPPSTDKLISTLSFGTTSYEIQNGIFVLPTQSAVSTNSITIVAAVLTSLIPLGDPIAVLYVPSQVPNMPTKIVTRKTQKMSKTGEAGPYTIFKATIPASGNHIFVAKVELAGISSGTIKTRLFINGR